MDMGRIAIKLREPLEKPMNFEFATAQRILFGPGLIRELQTIAPALGSRAALVTGSSAERILPVFQQLKKCGANPAAFSITGEPTTTRIEAMAKQARNLGCDYVVAFGGGSVIDAGKALAALLTNSRELKEYLEVVGDGRPLDHDPAPCIAIPTTAGTGAEATRNAVLLSPEHQVKVSLRHPGMLPTVALVDPELTLSMPPAVTASTGLDAFIQLLEAFVSVKANPLTDGICREGLRLAARSLPKAFADGSDMAARTDMATASLFSGLALANAGLGAIHGFAGPLGGMYKAPHGMVCAALLPAVFEANVAALESRDPSNPALDRYREIAAITTGKPIASLGEAAEWIRALCAQLEVPGLRDMGVDAAAIPTLVEKAKQASSMKGNPIVLADKELAGILVQSMDAAAIDNP